MSLDEYDRSYEWKLQNVQDFLKQKRKSRFTPVNTPGSFPKWVILG